MTWVLWIILEISIFGKTQASPLELMVSFEELSEHYIRKTQPLTMIEYQNPKKRSP